jgi:hypothetical protein
MIDGGPKNLQTRRWSGASAFLNLPTSSRSIGSADQRLLVVEPGGDND